MRIAMHLCPAALRAATGLTDKIMRCAYTAKRKSFDLSMKMDGLLLLTVTVVFICSVVSSSRMNVEE